MPKDHRTILGNIRTFPQLIRYLRDEMGWPIDSDSFEDLTFDYDPQELGIEEDVAAKIQEIKRLRPLTPGQPWGIFFIKFEPKRLPVVALRRILSKVVLKKRASAGKAERPAWAADDMLFISNYGEGNDRQIAIAHFSQPADFSEMPSLKVLGWNNLDTGLHLDSIVKELTEHLSWPEDTWDVKGWRDQWRAAFTLRHREIITTSKELSIRLAELARAIRDRIKTALAIETEKGPLTQLMKAFKEAVVHDLDGAGFADMYAQTIAYGLLSARIADPHKKTADDFAIHMRTNPFLRELMETFLTVGGRRGKAGGPGIDFDELGVSEVVELLDDANMEAVVRDFGDRNPQEDPVIHFYEHFLAAYDKKQKVSRGVFYTPRPVVSYIVHSVDELLRTEFGIADGLADTITWGEMTQLHKDLNMPEGVSPNQDFVQILDPATGTGTFLVEVIDLIHKTLVAKWMAQGHDDKKIETLWNGYVPEHLLTRLHGYELLMAPYAIAHLKMGLKLYETGYHFGSDERARIYLTNALEPASDAEQMNLVGILPALAHEAKAVSTIKEKRCFTVVIGNPPYSGHSSNPSRDPDGSLSYAGQIIGRYFQFGGRPLDEKQPKWLHDDYVKFVRLAEVTLVRSGIGTLGLITNHGFLQNPTFRGMRESLLTSLVHIWAMDLEGSLKKSHRGLKGIDENIFDIEQGTAISIGVLGPLWEARSLHHVSVRGSRESKYQRLAAGTLSSTAFREVEPHGPFLLFTPSESGFDVEWSHFPSLKEVMPVSALGIVSGRDSFAIDLEKGELIGRLAYFCDPKNADAVVAKRFSIRDAGGYVLTKRRKLVLGCEPEKFIRRINYRPFDTRFVAYSRGFLTADQASIMRHLGNRKSLALATTRTVETGEFAHVFCTRAMMGHHFVSLKESNYAFPLLLKPEGDSEALPLRVSMKPNFSPAFLQHLTSALRLDSQEEKPIPDSLMPEDILHYIYALLHSPGYRSRYGEFLKTDFPRLPLTESVELFRALALRGAELVALHLLESPKFAHCVTEYFGARTPRVEKVSWSKNTVWLDKAQTIGFKGVHEEVWNLHIGGYQACEKWLKDRKGRTLSKHDILHYQKIIVALSETIRLMKEIDEVIGAHGGWPGAFQTTSEARVSLKSLPKVAELTGKYASAKKKKCK